MFVYSDGTATEENFHWSYENGLYGQGGFLLPNITHYLSAETEPMEANEFYQFPSEQTPLGQLEEDGWVDSQVRPALVMRFAPSVA